MSKMNTDKIVAVLNRILEAGVTRVVSYTHYSFLVFGFGRIPIVSWLRQQADESLLHAQQACRRMRLQTLGAYPSLAIRPSSWIHTSMTSPPYCESRWRAKAMGSPSPANCWVWWKVV